MRKFALLVAVCSIFLFVALASAQQGDVALGFSALMSPGAGACGTPNSSGLFSCPEKGGVYPAITADVIFHQRVGFGYEVTWRASQGAYGGSGGQPYRPIINDFNLVYQPRLSKKAGVDLNAGIGFQSTRYYLPFCTNSFNCTNFTSSHHFLVDLGGGLRYYVWGHLFVRPEARFYYVQNNTPDFTSGNLLRVGASIGYTIGPE